MKRVILPFIVLGLTMIAFADADLTSARIYRNQGELIKANNFFNLSIEKNPDQYTAYFERGEMYGMIATDRTKKGVLRELVGEIDNPQYEMLKLMLADFAVVKGIEDPKKLKKQKKNLKKIHNIVEGFWTDFYNESVDADIKHVEMLVMADSLFTVGDTARSVEGAEELTLLDKALNSAENSKNKVINNADICILMKPEEWNPYALKAQALDRIGETDQANVVWEKALVSLNSSNLRIDDEKKYTQAWRIIQLHLLQNFYNKNEFSRTIDVADEIIAVCTEEGFSPDAITEEFTPEKVAEIQHCRDAYVFKAFSLISKVNDPDSTDDVGVLRENAIEVLQDAQRVSPDDSSIPFYLGQFYLESGDTTKTLDWWRAYTELDTEDYEILFQLGYIYLEGGSFIDFKKSEAIYQELVDRHPEECTGWINLGISQIRQDRTKDGAVNVKKGEECSKNSGE